MVHALFIDILKKKNLYVKIDAFVALHSKLNNAVKAYDRLLEERLLKSAQRPYYPNPHHSYPQNYNQQNPIAAPVNPSLASANALYQSSYGQHSYVPVTPAPHQAYNNAAPSQQQPHSVAPSTSIQHPSFVAPAQPQHYVSTPTQQHLYAATPSQQQLPYASFPATPIQQYPSTPQQYTSNTPDTQTEYQQYQYPSVPTVAPHSNYYGEQSYYNSSQQPQQKQPVEEAPLIEL